MNRMRALILALMLLGGASSASAQSSGANRSELVRVRYIVNDVPATVAFHRDKLGFKLDFQSGTYFAALSVAACSSSSVPRRGRAAPRNRCRTASGPR